MSGTGNNISLKHLVITDSKEIVKTLSKNLRRQLGEQFTLAIDGIV